jgi:hypothetical protein
VEYLKMEIKKTIQTREFNLADILNYLVNFSRNRFEITLILMEQMMSSAYLAMSEKS